MKRLDEYPTPETDCFTGNWAAGQMHNGKTLFLHAQAIEQRLAACREALEMITTYNNIDEQCDNGYSAQWNAREALNLTKL